MCLWSVGNLDKASLLFSPNTDPAVRVIIRRDLNIMQVNNIDNYLGVPLAFGSFKKVHLRSINEKIEKRINSYNDCQPSQAGRAVLIQFVLQSIPLYYMGCFSLPKTFIHDFNMLLAKFWWSANSVKRKIHWRSWDKLCLSKLDGGLGFRDLHSFNLAMLAN